MKSIFISYRRTGTSGYGGRLQDDLGEHFGRERVFRDIDSIRPGTEFAQVIDRAIAQAGVVLALIGRNWLSATNKRRLSDPADFVRLEIESALKQGIVVLPVLIEGAKIPSAARLPESLSRLGRTQGIELSDDRWAYDLNRLIGVLEEFVGPSSLPAPDEVVGGTVVVSARLDPAVDLRVVPPGGAPAQPPAPTRIRTPSKPSSADRAQGAAASAAVAPGSDIGDDRPRLVLVDQRGDPVGPDEPPIVAARPGELTPAGVTVRGCGTLPDAVEMRVEGCPAAWMVLEPVVDLRCEGRSGLAVAFRPPRASDTTPGLYRVRLTVHRLHAEVVRSKPVQLQLRVLEYMAPVVRVVDGLPRERTCRTGLLRATDAGFAVSVHNGGNGPLGAQLSVTADDLVTRVWPAQISVAAGGEAQVRVRATPRRRWVGASSERPVTVAVAWDGHDEPTTLAVPLTHRPLLSVKAGSDGATSTEVPDIGSGKSSEVAIAVASPPHATRTSQGDS